MPLCLCVEEEPLCNRYNGATIVSPALCWAPSSSGQPYGVANRSGQPDYPEVLAIVRTAIEGGVNCFDTAAAYGSSEEVLGRALRELGMSERVTVVTKVRSLTLDEQADPARAAQAIENSVAASRQHLGLDCLPVVLFHRERDAVYLPVLASLQTRGWLRHAGVSCDNQPGPAVAFAGQAGVAALQLPANLLDHRHRRSGVLSVAASRGVALFIRSVFLQGLLLMPEDAIPPALREVIPARRRLVAIAEEGGLSLAELAVGYLLAQPGVTCVLVGVETVAQMRRNLAIFARTPLEPDLVRRLDAESFELPEAILTPWQWARLIEQEEKQA